MGEIKPIVRIAIDFAISLMSEEEKERAMATSPTTGVLPMPELDCYHKAEPGEPKFTLLGRDPVAPNLVRLWAAIREADYKQAIYQLSALMSIAEEYYEGSPSSDEQLQRACSIASEMEAWRAINR